MRDTLPWVLALAVGAMIACADATAPTSPDEVGTYRLAHVNGSVLPAPFPISGGPRLTATGGALVLTDAKQWNAEVTLVGSGGIADTPTNQISRGTYTRSRDTLFFRSASDGTIVAAALSGARIIAVFDGITLDFDRK